MTAVESTISSRKIKALLIDVLMRKKCLMDDLAGLDSVLLFDFWCDATELVNGKSRVCRCIHVVVAGYRRK